MEEIEQPLLANASSAAGNIRGMQILIKGLQYTVKSNVDSRKLAYILKDVNAFFNPGQMSCFIGPSGSGKTTLLDILAGRKTVGTIKGTVLFSNQVPTKMFLRRYAGYVEQFDTLLESLTVTEMLLYTAELKRPYHESLKDKKRKVDELIHKLSLENFKDHKIGKEGGVKKRVNIGIALITAPRVLFLDEPTTGLDSHTANEIMTVVKKLVEDGTTICSSIHGPTPYTFRLFDRVLFLLAGQVVFFGERVQAVPFLESFTSTEKQIFDNEAEWLTAVMVQAERDNKESEFASRFATSILKEEADRKIETFLSNADGIDDSTLKELFVKNSTVTPSWFALKTFIKYRTTKNFKDIYFWLPRIGEKIVFVFLLGITYFGMGNDMEAFNIYNLSSALFLTIFFPIFPAVLFIPTLITERALFYREVDDGLYLPGIYLLAKMLDETIVAIFGTAIFSTLSWYMMNFQGSILYMWALYFGHLMNGITTAYISASIFPDINTATSALQSLNILVTFFSGFMILPDDIPVYWIWAYYLNYGTYGFSAMMVNEFGEHDKEAMKTKWRLPTALELYQIENVDLSKNTMIVYIFCAVFIALGYLSMSYIRFQKR